MKSSSRVGIHKKCPQYLSINFNYFLLDPGDFVNEDEILARIETDKVTVDIAAPKSGVIVKYMADVGDTVEVGADFY